ncbi:hypothetical protein HJ024_22760 [Vibrio parahaemolyticus]|uniref:hypothetical protein n=1 Tax=Vibrio parahaemolyticus TaxID=670 RepID=UPI00084B2681|nr:hypothetical protein [Vibrio parahaemolyticus]EIZ0309917.1 hypothetical protein [Vibrio parahaemolyticus]MBE4413008.1 hypothetical protein [Vibrio parahaemolyticus]MDF4572516.1 hypothetical protein [Vibrio parahaemolyticus]ODZ62314.1 hypothetical protein BBM43_10100 [Vibrio parahaemolyticus]HBC3506533.1 hypothetical protein [Vibrio parahaemolyticus]
MSKDEKDKKESIWLIWLILATAPILFAIYAGTLLYLTWPIQKISISQSAVFGDSFGPLTALFSGLAFAGMIVTILLQRRDLALQREDVRSNRAEFRRAAHAQERSVRIAAITTLLDEYNARYKLNEESLSRVTDHSTGPALSIQRENLEIISKRGDLIRELESLLQQKI